MNCIHMVSQRSCSICLKKKDKVNQAAAQLALQILRDKDNRTITVDCLNSESAKEFFEKVKWWINWLSRV